MSCTFLLLCPVSWFYAQSQTSVEVVTEKEEFPFEKKDAFEIAISVKEDKFVVCSKVFF